MAASNGQLAWGNARVPEALGETSEDMNLVADHLFSASSHIAGVADLAV